jgi:hypothetical protein
MALDSEVDRIQRERERRRKEERQRAEEDRQFRRREVARLRQFDLSPMEGGFEDEPVMLDPVPLPPPPPKLPTTEGPRKSQSSLALDEEVSRLRVEIRAATGEVPPRTIGSRVHSEPFRRFMEIDPAEGFDIQDLNVLPLHGLVEEAKGEANLLVALAHRVSALMIRIKREVDDSLTAGAFLRDQVLFWYRTSQTEHEWVARATQRWGGLFSESRISGGKLEPWLNIRLWNLRDEVNRARGLKGRLKSTLVRRRGSEAAVTRTPAQQVQAEVAQAILDDLAGHARPNEGPLPLVRLSELAQRRQVPTINEALAVLFSCSESGPFVLLHPNRYPDCQELSIRTPSPGTGGAALAYSLSPAKSSRKPFGRERNSGGEAIPGRGSSQVDPDDSDFDEAQIWELAEVSEDQWRQLLTTCKREKHRLNPPPKDFRAREAYPVLRSLLLAKADVRSQFFGVRWRGRPAGLPLLASLFTKGSLAPDVSTDHEYLEAELNEICQPRGSEEHNAGEWNLPGWRVTRTGNHREGFRYTAEAKESGVP